MWIKSSDQTKRSSRWPSFNTFWYTGRACIPRLHQLTCTSYSWWFLYLWWWFLYLASSYWNLYRVSGQLWGDSTGHEWTAPLIFFAKHNIWARVSFQYGSAYVLWSDPQHKSWQNCISPWIAHLYGRCYGDAALTHTVRVGCIYWTMCNSHIVFRECLVARFCSSRTWYSSILRERKKNNCPSDVDIYIVFKYTHFKYKQLPKLGLH